MTGTFAPTHQLQHCSLVKNKHVLRQQRIHKIVQLNNKVCETITTATYCTDLLEVPLLAA